MKHKAKFYFSTTSAEKSANLKFPAKYLHIYESNSKKFCIWKNQLKKIYPANLNKNRLFQKISCEKCVNFASFWRIKIYLHNQSQKRHKVCWFLAKQTYIQFWRFLAVSSHIDNQLKKGKYKGHAFQKMSIWGGQLVMGGK